jgi:hypothetical protein
MIFDAPADIRTGHLPKARQKRYLLSHRTVLSVTWQLCTVPMYATQR